MSQHPSPFDAIRRIDENGNEYWSARELSKVPGYDRWENFRRYVIPGTQKAFENSEHAVSDHIRGTTKMIKAGKGAQRPVEDFELSRFACYLVVENADPEKPIVALGQHYFAVQTRRQEIADELALAHLPEDQKRLNHAEEVQQMDGHSHTSAQIWTGGPTRALPGVECRQPHLRQTPYPLSPYAH